MFTSSNSEIVLKQKRKALISVLRQKGIQSERVLAAIERIPRHEFIDSAFWHRAYEDTALPLLLKQTISQPYTVARQTELLEIQSTDHVLEIGTGSGYQCAVLCELAKKVYSIERINELYQYARTKLRNLNYRPMLKIGDGTLGWSAYSPYDAIIVTAGAPTIPEALIKQLAIGGRLVIPVGDENHQTMMRITKISEVDIQTEKLKGFKFVPLIGEHGW